MSLQEEEGGERVSIRGSVRSLGHFTLTGNTDPIAALDRRHREEEEE